MSRKLNANGIQLIKTFEGFRSKPYLDSVSIPTIGYGATHYADGTKVTMNDHEITEVQASQLMEDLLNKEFCPRVEKLITATISDNQFAACVSLAYNIGTGNFEQSTVLRCTNFKNWNDAAQSFLLWNKAGGKVLDGLTRRRQAEKDLYLKS